MKSSINKLIFILILFSLTLLTVSSCTKNAEVKDNDAKAKAALVGVWRGEGSYAGEEDAGWSETWKMVRQADGKYIVDYLILNDNEKLYELSKDEGTWSYEDGAYLEVNGNGDEVTYQVYSVKDDWFEYNIPERDGIANIQESKTVDTYQLQSPPKGYSLVSYDQPIDVEIEGAIGEADETITKAIEKAVEELKN